MSYRTTIARQPESLANAVKVASEDVAALNLAALEDGLVAVTGIGASFAAAVVTAAELQRIGKRGLALRAVDLMQPWLKVDAILAMSASGRSIEPVTAIRNHPEAMAFGITKEGNNPLFEVVKEHVRFESGSDATPSSTGYTGTLVAAGLLADRLAGKAGSNWAVLPEQADEILSRAGHAMERIGDVFRNRRAIDCVGSGAALGTADGASLLIREAARIPAGAADTLHYLHGPMEPMDASTGVVIFGDGREVKLAQDMAAIGSAVLLVTAEDVAEAENLCVIRVPAPESLIARGILDILSAQLLAAQLSDAAGLTDTKFRYRQTDTKLTAAA